MGVWLRSRDQTAKFGMAHEIFPRPKKARMSRPKVKTMVIVFFDSRGIVHKEFVPPGQKVNQAFYKDILERLRKRVQRVRTDIADNWVLHHDNAPSHTALAIREFMAKKNSRNSTSSLQPRSSSVRFLPLPKVEIEVEVSSFRVDRAD